MTRSNARAKSLAPAVSWPLAGPVPQLLESSDSPSPGASVQPGLDEELRHWTNFASNCSSIVLIVDRSGHLRVANPAFLKATGLNAEEVGRERASNACLHSIDQPFFHRMLECVSGTSWQGEVQCRRKDGSLFWCCAYFAPIQDNRGEVTHVIGICHDLTPLKEAEARTRTLTEQLHQSQKMEALGAMAGGIAHDFNNILAVISGFTQASLNDTTPDSPMRGDLRNILAAVNRGQELTRRILTFGRRCHDDRRPMDLSATLFEGLKLVRAAIPTTIAIREPHDGGPKIILGDETEWYQVITNLCVNAAQAIGHRSGEIEIELNGAERASRTANFGLSAPYLELAVHDSGPGIAPSDLPHLFDPFYTTKRRAQGTGLGLTIVQAIVAKSGGLVRAENRQTGGATIRILVPALASA